MASFIVIKEDFGISLFKKAIAAEDSCKSLLRNNSFASLIINSKAGIKIAKLNRTTLLLLPRCA